MWCIPPKANDQFVCAMENVLEADHQPYDPKRPLICMDEANKQLVQETRLPIKAEPGQPERFDYEYERNGTANIFMFCEPLQGWRHVNVTERRTKIDFAHQVKELLEVHYPDATCVRLVMDNLNTHAAASLYEAFEPAEARRTHGTTGDHLHAQTRELAQHRGDRTQRAGETMSLTPNPGPAHACA